MCSKLQPNKAMAKINAKMTISLCPWDQYTASSTERHQLTIIYRDTALDYADSSKYAQPNCYRCNHRKNNSAGSQLWVQGGRVGLSRLPVWGLCHIHRRHGGCIVCPLQKYELKSCAIGKVGTERSGYHQIVLKPRNCFMCPDLTQGRISRSNMVAYKVMLQP